MRSSGPPSPRPSAFDREAAASSAILVVLLDGLGDFPCPELEGRTPLEAADTPNLDRLAQEGASGTIYPLGVGRVPSSERAHFAYLGYSGYPFPGRSVLEALGRGLSVPRDAVVSFASLIVSAERNGCLYLQGRDGEAPEAQDDANTLLRAIKKYEAEGLSFSLLPQERGDAILLAQGVGSDAVTDSDPFSTALDHTDPFSAERMVMEVQPLEDAGDFEAAAATARSFDAYLRWAYRTLKDHPVNQQRKARGVRPLDCLVTKWTGRWKELPSFRQRTGMSGAIIASSRLYRGLAALLGIEFVHVPSNTDPAQEMRAKLAQAAELLRQGFDFVHLHTKAADEAGHMRDPRHKKEVIEGLDRGLAVLWHDQVMLERTIVAVTSDHCTPSWGPLLHAGDSVPLVIRGRSVRIDSVTKFGERAAVAGALGQFQGSDLMPLLLNLAGRAAFLGARASPQDALGRPTGGKPFRTNPPGSGMV